VGNEDADGRAGYGENMSGQTRGAHIGGSDVFSKFVAVMTSDVNAQQGTIHDACAIDELIEKTHLFVTCTHNVFEGDKAMVTQSKCAMDLPGSKLTRIQDPRIFPRSTSL